MPRQTTWVLDFIVIIIFIADHPIYCRVIYKLFTKPWLKITLHIGTAVMMILRKWFQTLIVYQQFWYFVTLHWNCCKGNRPCLTLFLYHLSNYCWTNFPDPCLCHMQLRLFSMFTFFIYFIYFTKNNIAIEQKSHPGKILIIQ